jgi:carbonic anhydrase
VAGQSPFAIILGCSDSRVPAELIFGQGVGDLFVVRVAGNIVTPSQLGSIEFAAERFGTRLVVVLGHSQCGAVTAVIEHLEQPREIRSPNLAMILDRIRPSVEPLLATGSSSDSDALLRDAVHANVRASVHQLQRESEVLRNLAEKEGLLVVGAEYSLETGVVNLLEDEPGEK